MVPFTREAFFSAIAAYNDAVVPTQILLVGAALAAVLGLFASRPIPHRAIGGLLAVLWIWIGIAFHFAWFSYVTPAAWLFGAMSIAGGAVFAWHAARGTLVFDDARGFSHVASIVLFVYALVGYPLLALAVGQTYPELPTFGLPCPVTIFTFGVLLRAKRPLPASLLVVPLGWSVIGTSAATQLGVTEDYGLIVAAVVVVAALLWKNRIRLLHHAEASR